MGNSERCIDDELPFDIPENWKFARVERIVNLFDGPTHQNESLPYLEAKFLRGQKTAEIISNGKLVEQGEHVILVDGENSGEVFQVLERGYQGSTFKILYIPNCLNSKYVIYFLKFYKDTFRGNKKGSAIPHLNKELFFNLMFSIPPLKEQKRIVEKLDSLLNLVDNL